MHCYALLLCIIVRLQCFRIQGHRIGGRREMLVYRFFQFIEATFKMVHLTVLSKVANVMD